MCWKRRIGPLSLTLWVMAGWMLLGIQESHAGPWSQAPGHFYVKLAETLQFGKVGLDTNNQPSGGDYFGASTSLYGEVGLYYGFQLQFFLPYNLLRITRGPGEFYQVDSFADSLIGFQWTPPPLQKLLKFPIAVRFNAKVPLYDQQSLFDNPETKDIAIRNPIIGEGQLDFTLWLSAGGSIPNTDLYLFGEVGYRFRTETFIDKRNEGLNLEFLDTFVFQMQVGYFLLKRVLFMLNVNGAIPLGSEAIPLTKGSINIGLGVYVPIWKGLAVEANFDQTVWYVFAPPVTAVTLGVSFKY